jgi:hypothetical protein
MRRQMILAVSSLALLGAAGPAWSQAPQLLSLGQRVDGEITPSDARGRDDAYVFDAYSFEAREGQRLEAIMRSAAFDAALEVLAPGDEEPLYFDDDSLGEGTDARLRFVAPEDGVYILRARTLQEDGLGPYSLDLVERPPAARPPRPAPLRLGRTVQGDIGDRDPEDENGLAYDAFSFRARAGDRFLIALDSDSFDPIVRVGRMAGDAFEELDVNDDGVDSGLNARLLFVAPEAGTYVVRAASLSQSRGGGYSITLSEGPEPLSAQDTSIGSVVEGSLSEEDGRTASGAPADAWRFVGRRGQRIRIDMTSGDFDTLVELFGPDGSSLASDDDGGPEGTDSRLIITLPADGTYVIEARAFASATGHYRLSLEEMEPERPPEPLAFGASLQGEIDDGDSRDDQDRGFDAFRFSGLKGQRIQAIMRSGDFDTYLQVGRADDAFSALASDDDGLGEGTDSRLNYTLPEDGEYVLRASPLGSEGKGLYALELIDRGPEPLPGSLLVGATARGVLTEADATANDNSFYDAYRVSLKADEKLLAIMVSNEVDSFLTVGQVGEGGDYEVLAQDDDGLSDTNAKLGWAAPADGVYEFRAGSFQQGQTGAYALILEKQP